MNHRTTTWVITTIPRRGSRSYSRCWLTLADSRASFAYQTCHYYLQALRYGVKYIYQTMPRLLTLWLDLGESADGKKYGIGHSASADVRNSDASEVVKKLTPAMDRARKELPEYQVGPRASCAK